MGGWGDGGMGRGLQLISPLLLELLELLELFVPLSPCLLVPKSSSSP